MPLRAAWKLRRAPRSSGAIIAAMVRAAICAGAVAIALALMAAIAGAAQQTRTPDIHFVPTPDGVVDAMLKLARVTASDVVYDLGSGDGRIVIAAARDYGARGVGVELDPDLVRKARERAMKAGVADKVSFVQGDLFEADLSQAT